MNDSIASDASLTGFGRYELEDRLEERQQELQSQVRSWRGRDRVLDRQVLIRVVRGPLREVAEAAARTAAVIEDQRLTRVLDIVPLPAGTRIVPQGEPLTEPATALVSEWAEGLTLPEIMDVPGQKALSPARTLAIIDAVSAALVTASARGVQHGRLTPEHVLVGPDESVRVRGLAVDAALFGAWPRPVGSTDIASVDVAATDAASIDAASINAGSVDLGSTDVAALTHLLYLLSTGSEPTSTAGGDEAEKPNDPPSWLNPAVPKQIDLVVAQVFDGSYRSAWNRSDVQGFRTALGLVGPSAPRRRTSTWGRLPHTGRRVLAVFGAAAVVAGIFTTGAVLLTIGPPAWQPQDPEITSLLTSPVVAPTASEEPVTNQPLVIERIRSYDPYDDDNDDGRPDGRKGRENNKAADAAIDGDPMTRWSSNTYRAADADGKGGVGLVVELTEASTVQGVDLDFSSVGSAVDVKVGDDIWPDPDLWTDYASAPAGDRQISIRGPRPVKGKYLLLWFPELPPTPEDPDRFQVRVAEVSVRGE